MAEMWADKHRAIWALLPGFCLMLVAHWVFLFFEERGRLPLSDGFILFGGNEAVFTAGLWIVSVTVGVALLSVRWQSLVLGLEKQSDLWTPTLRYAAEWGWRTLLLAVPFAVLICAPLLASAHVLDYAIVPVLAEQFSQILQAQGIPFRQSLNVSVIATMGLVFLPGVPIYLYFWLRLAQGLPGYLATGRPLSLRASWRRTRSRSRAILRAAFGGTALWLAIKLSAWSLTVVASFEVAPGREEWMFAARVAIPPLNTALIQLIAAGLLARVYLATEPDPAEVF